MSISKMLQHRAVNKGTTLNVVEENGRSLRNKSSLITYFYRYDQELYIVNVITNLALLLYGRCMHGPVRHTKIILAHDTVNC